MTHAEKLSQARAFILERVLTPASSSNLLSEKTRNVVKNSKRVLNEFKRVGDLVSYLERFTDEQKGRTHAELTSAGLLTFEDIRQEFIATFGRWSTDKLRLVDFVEGRSYSSFDLSFFSGKYDVRGGGILLIGSPPTHTAVLVKATLSDGKYPNAWIEKGLRLKYYLKSIRNKFSEEYKENAAIIKHPNVPIYVFTRDLPQGDYTFQGEFSSNGVHEDRAGGKWFDLTRITSRQTSHDPISKEAIDLTFEAALTESTRLEPEQRAKRLAGAPRKPREVMVTTRVFYRNPDVVAEVLSRAGGVCELCKKPAPFARRVDGSAYLEVHHKLPLGEGGDDTIENAVAACPNCHRNEHFGNAVFPWSGSS